MASQSLYRKWRSQTFGELVGQEPVIRTLKNALSSGNLAHAYLFTGPRGTGKTSTARLLAKTINCLALQNGEPCNKCEQCREITNGNSFNVIEIDAASNRGIDSIRELREKVTVPPSTGKYKVYILDEAHMLTVEAFNALLKTLEEPPPHAIFVMATTDVHKMLPTVLSRCQRFDFKRFTMRQLIDRLKFVAEQEDVTIEHGAAELIARAAAGGMRDALSLLDQAIAYSGQRIALEQVQTMLGVADPRAIQKFIALISSLDSAAGLHLIHELTESGADLRQINSQVAEYCRAMMLTKAGASIAAILDSSDDEIREITESSQLFLLEELTEFARVFAQNDLMQKSQGSPQLGLELALLTCIELHRRQTGASPVKEPPAVPTLAPAQRVNASQMPHIELVPPPGVASPVKPFRRPPEEVLKNLPLKQEPAATIAQEKPADLPDWDALSYKDEEVSVIEQTPKEPAHDVEENSSPSLGVQQVKEKWEYVKKRAKTKKDGAKVAAILNGYTVVGVEGSANLPVVLIQATAQFHYTALQKKEYHTIIEWAMQIEMGQQCLIRVLPPGHNGPSLPTLPRNEKSEVPLARINVVRENTNIAASKPEPSSNGETRLEFVKKQARNDPVVQKAVEMFKAEIKDINLK